jgi:large subunit ribosomal protein L24
MKLKKGDEVKITIGKDKGKTGKITETFPKENKILIAGLNVYKRHVKPQGQNKPGGIIDISKPLSSGNIALICPKCKKPSRVGFKIEGSVKSRICKKCGEII